MTNLIEIVGGGLAGLSLGVGLRKRGVPVCLWEAGSYPRHRVCGEFICGVRASTLEELGISDALKPARTLTRASWRMKNREVFQIDLPLPASGISRHFLDHYLAERFVKLGGELKTQSRFRTAELPREGMVWAAGRLPSKDGLLGLKMHVRNFSLEEDLEMHFAPNGYAGASWVEDDQVNVCALLKPNPGIKAPRDQLFIAYFRACGMTHLADRLEAADIDPDSHCAISAVPAGYCRTNLPNGFCAVGDHFGMMGPFTGNGMSMAFESSALAVDPLTEYAKGERGWAETVELVMERQHRQFQSRLRLSHRLHEVVLNPLGLRALAILGSWKALPFHFLFRQLR